MPRPIFANACYYHVYNRGVLKQPIFLEEIDYVRFVQNLYIFNDTLPAKRHRNADIGCRQRKQVVSILAWCLMPNHFHLFLEQREEGGVTQFMRKMGDGYTKYMNKKYERTGHLFQGKFQAKIIQTDPYFLHISRYLHRNPLDLLGPGFDGPLHGKKFHQAMQFLEIYRWSSYLDWIGTTNFPSLLDLKEVAALTKNLDYQRFVLADAPPTSDVGI